MTTSAHAKIDGSRTGIVFDIKRFASGDGPGIRALIFLKGCPLRCLWCANPESHRTDPEVIYHRSQCVGCGKCIEICPARAIRRDEAFGLLTDRDACTGCGRCADACVFGARELVGRSMSVHEVMRIVRRDRRFYDNSGGGVTISGGEPLSQCAFTRDLLHALRAEGIHTAIETCGHAPWECVESVLPYLDLLFFDLKHADPQRHRELTGQSNELILSNLARTAHAFDKGEMIVRVPYVPGQNDETHVLRAILESVRRLPNIARTELLPYHRLGMGKYAGLGLDYKLADIAPADAREMESLRKLGEELGITVRIDSV